MGGVAQGQDDQDSLPDEKDTIERGERDLVRHILVSREDFPERFGYVILKLGSW